MRKIVALILLTYINILNAQNVDEAKHICKKYIVNGKAVTPNEIVNGLKSGIWAQFYDKNENTTNNVKDAKSFQIVLYKANVPSGFCVICSVESNLLGIESYLEDTTWTENGSFLWFNEKGILIDEENYSNGLLSGMKANYFKTGEINSNIVYRNDTVISAKFYWLNGNYKKTYDYTYFKDSIIISTNEFTKEGILLNANRTINGLKDGNNIVYYKNGSKRIEGIDKMGIRLKENYFHKDGHLIKAITCDPISKECKVVVYDKNNKIKKEYTTIFRGYGTVIYK